MTICNVGDSRVLLGHRVPAKNTAQEESKEGKPLESIKESTFDEISKIVDRLRKTVDKPRGKSTPKDFVNALGGEKVNDWEPW